MKETMELKICLVSEAAEFAREREELQTFVTSFNAGGGNVHYELLTDLPEPEAQYFYMLIGAECSGEERETFHKALARFQEAGTPLLYTYFRRRPEDTPITQSVREFMRELDEEIGHFFSLYTDLDSVKLNILLELARKSGMKDSLSFHDGKACFGEKEVLSLENIPLYKENKDLQEMLARQKELSEAFEEAAAAFAHDPKNVELFMKKEEISGQQLQLFNTLKKMENEILGLLMEITERTGSTEKLTGAEKLAIRELEAGHYENAAQILRRADRSKAQMPAETILFADKKVLEGYVSENRLLIKTLMASGVTRERAAEIRACWEEILRLTKGYGLDPRKALEYVQYLAQTGEAAAALEVLGLLEKLYRICEVPEREQAGLIIEKGILYDMLEQYKEAEQCMIRGVKELRMLAEKDPQDRETFESLVLACYNMGVFEKDHFGKLEQAERYLGEAEEGYLKLYEAGEKQYEIHLARTYLSQGDVYQLQNKKSSDKKAGELYDKALEIIEKKAQDDYMQLGQDLAELCLRRAAICSRQEARKEAYLYAEKAWRTYDKMARISPALYQNMADMARERMVKTGMAEMQHIEKQKKMHLEEIQRLNKQATKPKIKVKEKRLLLEKALKHVKELEKMGVKEPEMGDIYGNYGNTLSGDAAAEYYEKAWEFYAACFSRFPNRCLSELNRLLGVFIVQGEKGGNAEKYLPYVEQLLGLLQGTEESKLSLKNLTDAHGSSGDIYWQCRKRRETEEQFKETEKYLLLQKEQNPTSAYIHKKLRENAYRLRHIYLDKEVKDSYTEQEVEDLYKRITSGFLKGLIQSIPEKEKYEQTAQTLVKGAAKAQKKKDADFEEIEWCLQVAKVLYCQLEEAFPGQYQKKILETDQFIEQHHSHWKES